MVAIYTAAKPGNQSQALAYSTDKGRTWTRYAGNPVLDIGSGEFRDPKVFWYAPENKWVMAVVMAVEHKVRLYSSKNLKDWTLMSDFGPANAVGGVWECPDLFPLAGRRRPGQDQVGDGGQPQPRRDPGRLGRAVLRRRLRRHALHAPTTAGAYTPPAGDVYADFEGANYGAWTATGTAFGAGPAQRRRCPASRPSPASAGAASSTASSTSTARRAR